MTSDTPSKALEERTPPSNGREDVSERTEVVADPLRAALYEGYIDAIEDGRIYGWALDTVDKSKRLSVSIRHGADHLGTLVSDRYREDLVGYGDGSGRHAFVFDIPKHLRAVAVDEFAVVFEGTDVPLLRGQRATSLTVEAFESNVAEAGDINIHRLVSRLEAAERITVGLIRMVHPESGGVGDVKGKVTEIERAAREVEQTSRTVEGYVVRMDESLKTLAERVEALEADRRAAGLPKGYIYLGVLVSLIVALTVHAMLGWPLP